MEDYPRTLQEFEARFSTEEGCREYLFQIAVAGGVSMSALRMWQGVGGSCHLVPVFELRLSDLGDGWHRVPGHAEASRHLVSGDVVCDQPEERRQRTGLAASPRTG